MDNFYIILPNEKRGTYKILTLIIALINIVGYVYLSIHVDKESVIHDLLPAAISLCATPLTLYFFYKKGRESSIFQILFSFFLASILWVFTGFYLMGFLLFTFALTGVFALRKLKVAFDNNIISYPSFPHKKLEWNEVSNLILKDNILTIDFKNNKLIQHTINENENKDLDETAFNTFVQKQLNNITQF
jgi:hypothetical protein